MKEFFYFYMTLQRFFMKRSILLTTLCCLIFGGMTAASAQNAVQHQKGEDLNQHLSDSIKFIFPEFQSGIITFSDGSHSRGPVNISTIEQRIYFISAEGAYQVLVNEDQVRRVSIKDRSFVKTRYGYVELLDYAAETSLGAVRRTSFFETETKGAYGMASQTTSVATIGQLQQNGNVYTLGVDQSTPFKYKIVPYLYRNGKVLISNKKNFQKCFPDKKAVIEQYLKDKPVDFENFEEVESLFNALK